MDPNSQHQLWSRWTFEVFGPFVRLLPQAVVDLNCTQQARRVFGTAGQINIEYGASRTTPTSWKRGHRWLVDIRVEGHPAHDPQYKQFTVDRWEAFFKKGFGPNVTVESRVKIEAGDKQDGRPRDQLLIIPAGALALNEVSHG